MLVSSLGRIFQEVPQSRYAGPVRSEFSVSHVPERVFKNQPEVIGLAQRRARA